MSDEARDVSRELSEESDFVSELELEDVDFELELEDVDFELELVDVELVEAASSVTEGISSLP